MRYLLMITGICLLLVGTTFSARDAQSTWIISGVICVSVGLAAIEIVNAVGTRGGDDFQRNLRRFHDALDAGRTESAVEILTDHGIDKATAESAVLATMNSSSRAGDART